MEIFNVGPLELIIILLLMFIILGPKDMVKTAQSIGRWVRNITTSPMWREVWGISQDIRELPKKLMEDTGLEEALTDVKNTTQEVANEFNTQIKEATEAARVPEIEHLRIDPTQTIAPPANTVPAVLPAVVETAGPEATVEQPAVVDVVEEAAAPAPRKPRRKKQALEPVGEGLEAQAAEPAKKPRRKKQAAEGTLPAETPPAEPAQAVLPASEEFIEQSAPVKDRKPRRKKVEPAAIEALVAKDLLVVNAPVEHLNVELPAAEVLPAAVELPVVGSPVEPEAPLPVTFSPEPPGPPEMVSSIIAPVEQAEPVKVRKPRRKKGESAVVELPAAEEQPIVDQIPVTINQPAEAAPAAQFEPPKVRKPRKKKLDSSEKPAAVPVVESIVPEPLAIEPAEAQGKPADIVLADVVEERLSGSQGTPAADQPPAVKKPRRRKQAESVIADVVAPTKSEDAADVTASTPEGAETAALADSTAFPAAPRRRARKAAVSMPVEMPAVVTTTPVETTPSNGQPAGDIHETPAPLPSPRKRRAPRSASTAPAVHGNGTDQAGVADKEKSDNPASSGNGIKPARTRKKRLAEPEQTQQAAQTEAPAAEALPVERTDRDAS